MQFAPTEDQQMIRETLRRLGPAPDAPLDRARLEALAEHGLLGMALPTSRGGFGLAPTTCLLALEELARFDASAATAVATHAVLAAGHLLLAGGSEAHGELLARAATGERLLTWAGAPADPVVPGSVALALPPGALADVVVVARGDDGSAWLLEAPGERLAPLEDGLGLRRCPPALLKLEGAAVDAAARLSRAPRGEVLARGRLAMAAVLVGVARASLEEALAYAQEREQFGLPLVGFQAIQFKLSDMATAVDMARLAALEAASLLGEDDDCWARPAGVRFASRAAGAHLLACRAALLCSDEGLQIHGGYGYVEEYPIEGLYRDARALASFGLGSGVDPAGEAAETVLAAEAGVGGL